MKLSDRLAFVFFGALGSCLVVLAVCGTALAVHGTYNTIQGIDTDQPRSCYIKDTVNGMEVLREVNC